MIHHTQFVRSSLCSLPVQRTGIAKTFDIKLLWYDNMMRPEFFFFIFIFFFGLRGVATEVDVYRKENLNSENQHARIVLI